MSANPTAGLWARTALIWFVITLCFGMYLGMTRQFHLGPSHAHMGVLGWLSSAVFATIYMVAGAGPAGSKSPILHWAVHNVGVAIMTGALFMELSHPGGPWGGIIPIGGALIVLGAIWLAIMVWPRLGRTG